MNQTPNKTPWDVFTSMDASERTRVLSENAASAAPPSPDETASPLQAVASKSPAAMTRLLLGDPKIAKCFAPKAPEEPTLNWEVGIPNRPLFNEDSSGWRQEMSLAQSQAERRRVYSQSAWIQ